MSNSTSGQDKGESSALNGAIDPQAKIGLVTLTVSDLAKLKSFYVESIGLETLSSDSKKLVLGVGGVPLLLLIQNDDATPRTSGTPGLYHVALLVPSRLALARRLKHFIDNGVGLHGAADHLVSEALYLQDPEGNGLEVYWDRPPEMWRDESGAIQMSTDPLDVEGLLWLVPDPAPPSAPLPAGTRIGHIHLQVTDLNLARRYYCDGIGFEAVFKMPSALFVSAGGYHHHIGLNTWGVRREWADLSEAAPGSILGLRRFEVVVSTTGELPKVESRLAKHGFASKLVEGTLESFDPSGNVVTIRDADDSRNRPFAS